MTLLATHAYLALAYTDATLRVQRQEVQLRRAIDSRDVIGQAKGIIMARRDVSADEAFDILRRTSPTPQHQTRAPRGNLRSSAGDLDLHDPAGGRLRRPCVRRELRGTPPLTPLPGRSLWTSGEFRADRARLGPRYRQGSAIVTNRLVAPMARASARDRRVSLAFRPPALSPAWPAVIGFGVAGVILMVLDLRTPTVVITEMVSAHAGGALRIAFVLALLASCVGVGASIVWAGRSARGYRTDSLVLLALWPVGIALATVFDEAERTVTGTVHNVAVGIAVVAVHLAALRAGARPLRRLATAGFISMAVLLTMIVLKAGGDAELPVGVIERVLVAMCAVVTIGALREPRPPHPGQGGDAHTCGISVSSVVRAGIPLMKAMFSVVPGPTG
ncbi:ANTAR domain-containing protein [Actinomycetes bacterium KLBMP 9759]